MNTQETNWKKRFKIFKEVGKQRVSSATSKENQLLSTVLEEFINSAYQEGRRAGMEKPLPTINEPSETEVLRFYDDINTLNLSNKNSGPRKKSEFVQEILTAGIKSGDHAYISHKEWLENHGGNKLSLTSQKKGPKEALKKYGFNCISGNIIDAKELKPIADNEGRELTAKDTIYEITCKA